MQQSCQTCTAHPLKTITPQFNGTFFDKSFPPPNTASHLQYNILALARPSFRIEQDKYLKKNNFKAVQNFLPSNGDMILFHFMLDEAFGDAEPLGRVRLYVFAGGKGATDQFFLYGFEGFW